MAAPGKRVFGFAQCFGYNCSADDTLYVGHTENLASRITWRDLLKAGF